MDLLKHLEALEAFSRQTGMRLFAEGSEEQEYTVLTRSSSTAGRTRARALLERLGGVPTVTTPESGRHPAQGAPPNIRFRSIDQEQLETNLCKLGTFEALTRTLEEGLRDGAFSIVNDRVLINPLEEEGDGGKGFDITTIVQRAGVALKARDAASLLHRMSSPVVTEGGEARPAAPTDRQGLPTFVKLRQEEGRPAPVLRDGPETPDESLRGRVRELFRRHPVLASMEELGTEAVYMVVGKPIRMIDGRYLPLEAVEEEARAGLLERLRARDAERTRPLAYVRADEVEELELPKQYLEPEIPSETFEPDALPSNARIELAYRLVKGLSLAPEEGQPIEIGLRARLENVLGADFSDVRLHTGAAAKYITESLGARAVTQGTSVFIPKEHLVETDETGRQTLVHELVHVRQHLQGEDFRPREQLETEAHSAERHQLEGPSFNWSEFVPPTPQGVPVEQGIYMAPKETRPVARDAAPKKVPLKSEDVLEKIEQRLREQEAREKEARRDRVF